MNERTKWAGALLLALATNALLLIVILLQTSGLLFLYGSSSCDTNLEAIHRCRSELIQMDKARVDMKTDRTLILNFNRQREQFLKSSSQNPDHFVLFSNWQDVKSRSDRLKILQQEILDIVSGETFVEKVIDTLERRQNSGFEMLPSRPIKKIPQGFMQTVLKPLQAKWSKQETVRIYESENRQRNKNVQHSMSQTQDMPNNAPVFVPEFIFNTAFSHNAKSVDKENPAAQEEPVHSKKTGLLSRRKKRNVILPQGDGPHRRSDLPPEDEYGLNGVLALEEIFSSFTDSEIEALPDEIRTLILPALVHFEGLVIRQLESLHATMVSHDLRLETLEKAHLNWLNNGGQNAGNSSSSNKTEDFNEVIDDGFIPTSGGDMIALNDEGGSGEVDDELVTTTQTSTSTTTAQTTQDQHLYELYRTLTGIEQKVMALENYNVMSDSELIRTRNEVIKMDDRVTEMDRRHRNLKIRTAMQNYRVTELENFMGKTELALHTTLDSFSRMTQRLDSFKDRMSEYKSDILNVQSQFGRQSQIMTELRSADSYKAHDINELRKSLLGLEERLNSLYRVLDQNVDTVRGDIRTMVERLCFNNNLAC